MRSTDEKPVIDMEADERLLRVEAAIKAVPDPEYGSDYRNENGMNIISNEKYRCADDWSFSDAAKAAAHTLRLRAVAAIEASEGSKVPDRGTNLTDEETVLVIDALNGRRHQLENMAEEPHRMPIADRRAMQKTADDMRQLYDRLIAARGQHVHDSD